MKQTAAASRLVFPSQYDGRLIKVRCCAYINLDGTGAMTTLDDCEPTRVLNGEGASHEKNGARAVFEIGKPLPSLRTWVLDSLKPKSGDRDERQ